MKFVRFGPIPFSPEEWARVVHLAQMARQRGRVLSTPTRLTPAATRAGSLLRTIAWQSHDRRNTWRKP